jgi:hypothetical protein
MTAASLAHDELYEKRIRTGFGFWLFILSDSRCSDRAGQAPLDRPG